MIPIFPLFKKLALSDRSEIEEITNIYPPYSDFNFISLWSWSTEHSTYISTLNGNLVIQFNDYITNEPFYTFIGTKKIITTIKILLEQSSTHQFLPYLKLIPEVTIQTQSLLFNRFSVKEDRDNFDYIYSIADAIELKGNRLRAKRNFVSRFQKKYQFSHRLLKLSNTKQQKEILNLFETWRKERSRDPMEVQNELRAIQRVFHCSKLSSIVPVGLYSGEQLIGFSINEILGQGYAVNLFEKASIRYDGIFPYLRHIAADYLSRRGCQFLNHEQDLGIEGLRKSKLSYCPKFFLKKYIIAQKPA